ncbi:MAG: hypothetical protein D6814_03760 [Calditrichaeota bacterium]|nr:MAG: hypothetical protein D6814_03760 [Calditrichota bacterium]
MSVAQETHIRGFADIDFTAPIHNGHTSQFGLGQYDLYITSELSDRFSFLGETVFEYDESFVVDVERVLVKFEYNDYLNIIFGKHHTPIGYWNTAYHHGTLLQPTSRRPLLFLFEDEGGILPIHTTGLMISGSNITPLNFGYDVLVGNGVGSTPVEDNDNHKSLTLALHSRPVEGLELGASAYFDKISAGTLSLQNVPLAQDISQQIFTGSLAYLTSRLEIISEYVLSNNHPQGASTQSTHAFYVYTGYPQKHFTPYLLYDRIRYPRGEKYYVKNDVDALILGLRFNFSYLSTLKLEFQLNDSEIDGKRTVAFAQFAIGF